MATRPILETCMVYGKLTANIEYGNLRRMYGLYIQRIELGPRYCTMQGILRDDVFVFGHVDSIHLPMRKSIECVQNWDLCGDRAKCRSVMHAQGALPGYWRLASKERVKGN